MGNWSMSFHFKRRTPAYFIISTFNCFVCAHSRQHFRFFHFLVNEGCVFGFVEDNPASDPLSLVHGFLCIIGDRTGSIFLLYSVGLLGVLVSIQPGYVSPFLCLVL